MVLAGRSVGIGIGSGRRTRHMMCERYASEIESASALSDLVVSSHGMAAGVFVVSWELGRIYSILCV